MLHTELAVKNERRAKISETRADRVFDIMNYVILTICLLVVAYPLYFIVIASISEKDSVEIADFTTCSFLLSSAFSSFTARIISRPTPVAPYSHNIISSIE